MITSADLLLFFDRFAARIAEKKDYLTELDSAIGDADHGANMHRGLQAILAKRADLETKDPSALLKAVAMILISTVGGASGALYGTFFLQSSLAAAGKSELDSTDLVNLLEKGLGGVIQRGKAAPGDKTMIDALEPAIRALKASLEKNETLKVALDQAVKAGDEAVIATIPLIARKGRASYLGERSIGHADPGATSAALLIKSLAETLQ
jgi:phosphoenolpyruvate---glycerone phosphotransferase subunit DhaL